MENLTDKIRTIAIVGREHRQLCRNAIWLKVAIAVTVLSFGALAYFWTTLEWPRVPNVLFVIPLSLLIMILMLNASKRRSLESRARPQAEKLKIIQVLRRRKGRPVVLSGTGGYEVQTIKRLVLVCYGWADVEPSEARNFVYLMSKLGRKDISIVE